MEKRKLRLLIQKLLNDRSIQSNILKPNTFSLNFNTLSDSDYNVISNAIYNESIKSIKSEKSSDSIISEIPSDFLKLLESEIFNLNESEEDQNQNKKHWREFTSWARFIGPNCEKKFHNHCSKLWKKISNASSKRSSNNYVEKITLEDIAINTTKKVAEGKNLEGYYHVKEPQCFKNALGETMVDFFKLPDSTVAGDTYMVVDQYYDHTRQNSSHGSSGFKKGYSEHFGTFTCSNIEPYVTQNTTSSHCLDHQLCVQNLIEGLQPLSNNVNNYLQTTYPNLYAKMKELDLGPNVPKSFGGFPTIAINYNTISQFHRDPKDHPNTLCVVCPLGSFTGGELVFPELKLVIHAKQGYAIAFRSHILVHGNLEVTLGRRHSVVFFVHSNVIKQHRSFGELGIDWGLDAVDFDYNESLSTSTVPNRRRDLLGK